MAAKGLIGYAALKEHLSLLRPVRFSIRILLISDALLRVLD